MGKRGPKPKGKVKIKWSADFAYIVGLIVTDGNLSSDGRHITFVSKDIEQINNFKKCLGLRDIKTGKNFSGYNRQFAHRVQFGDILFYNFLLSIGITPNKSKTIGRIDIPDKHFFDFLRGCFDGDGCTYSYWDPRWKSSFMFYTEFVSAGGKHISWLRETIFQKIGIYGHVTKDSKGSTYQLKYAKKESLILLKKMYYSTSNLFLSRKKLKIDKMLGIVGKRL